MYCSILLLAAILPLGSCDPSNVVDPPLPPPGGGPYVTAGLVAYYSFDGSAQDSSGHGNHGRAFGPMPTEDMDGVSGRAYLFDGATDHILLPDSLVQKCRSITITLWFKTMAGGAMFGYQSTPYPDFPPPQYVPAMYVGVNGRAYAEFWNGDDTPLASSTSVNDSVWHFMALIGSDSIQTLIVDDSVIGSMPGAIDHLDMIKNQIGMGNTGVNNSLGWPAGNDHWFGFAGSLDNVRIYDRPLRISECDTLYRFKK